MSVRFLYLVVTWLICAGLMGGSAFGHEVNWPGKRLAKLMPEADKFVEQQTMLASSQIAAIEQYPGITIEAKDRAPKFYLAYGKPVSPNGKPSLLGVIVFIDTIGQYGPIELSVVMVPDGKVLKADVWEHNDDSRITDAAFLRQFAGRTIRDEFHIGHELVVPEGGPRRSYEAIARGVQKALLMVRTGFGRGALPKPPAEEAPHED